MINKSGKALCFLCFLCFSFSNTFANPATSIVVFAGSASQPPLEEAARQFEAKTGIRVILHLGGSGAMLNQVRLSRQGDLFIPGSPDYMAKAKSLDLIEGESYTIAYLVPAIIVQKGNPKNIMGLSDLAKPGIRVGIADPKSVCVGLYAVELLEKNEMTPRIRPHLEGFVESCSKTAAMIPLKTVDAVLGWREFASWDLDAFDVVLLSPEQIPRLAYIPAAQLRHAKHPTEAKLFIEFLQSSAAQTLFRQWGYFTTEQEARLLAPRAKIGGEYHLPGGW
jgi:molybdate transport system substrate-binding protein